MMKIEDIANEFREAILECVKHHGDTDTPAKDLASRRSTAREMLSIAGRRFSNAVVMAAAADAADMNAQAALLTRKADDAQRQADLAQATAEGTLKGLFGETTAGHFLATSLERRSLRAIELQQTAMQLRSEADALKTDANQRVKSAGQQSEVRKDTITVARVKEFSVGQLANQIDNLDSAAVNGRIVEG